jgi:hypothetical protein
MNPSNVPHSHPFLREMLDSVHQLSQKLEHLDALMKEYNSLCGDLTNELSEDQSETPFRQNDFEIHYRLEKIWEALLFGITEHFYKVYRDLYPRHHRQYWINPITSEILLDAIDDLINRVHHQLEDCQRLEKATTRLQQRFKSRYYAPGSGRGAQRTQQHYQTLKFE